MELKNQTILITGGTSGFGLEFATRFIELGNTVIITGRNQAKLNETKKLLPAVHTFKSDVSQPEDIALLYKQITQLFPTLNILINNAGEMRRLNLLDSAIDQENVNREIAINLSGPVRMIQEFLPHLLKQQSAAIINVTSGLALVPFPLSPVYSASKAGLRAYTRSLRVQLKKTNVKVFELVAPGAKTPLNDKFENDVDSKTMMDPVKLIAIAIKGIKDDQYEIYPGLARVLKIMSRVAPGLIFNQMAGIAEKGLK